MKAKDIILNNNGAVLITGLLFLLLLAIMGTTAYLISSQDSNISANYKGAEEAFYDAESGVNFVISLLENRLKSDETFKLPEVGDDPIDLNATAYFGAELSSLPLDYKFTISSLENVSFNNLFFTSIGKGSRGATAKITASIKQGSPFSLAAFGNAKLDINTVNVFSYNSKVTDTPTAADSTGEADISSNGLVDIDAAIIDGDVLLGGAAPSGDPPAATTYGGGGPTISGEDGKEIGFVDPDPLDILEKIPDYFDTYGKIADGLSNENEVLMPGIGETINGANPPVMLVGEPGGANYFFDGITLGNLDRLTINATDGPVNIYLKGKLTMGNGSFLTITGNSADRRVSLYITEPDSGIPETQSIVSLDNGAEVNMLGEPIGFGLWTDSDAKVLWHAKGTIKGTIYAPEANVSIGSNTTLYGSVWADEVTAAAGATIFYDTMLANTHLTKDVVLTTWVQDLLN
jgi:hypothetical protein